MSERTPEQIEDRALALRNLRTTLRVAAADLSDLEARIKYAALTEAEGIREAHEIWTALGLEIADAKTAYEAS